jgi:hypothetical protein
MTLDYFDPKLLKFMYFLVTRQRFMNSVQIADELRINGEHVTDRTVRRWMTFLNNERNFNYFINAKHESLGLMPIFVLMHNLKKTKVLDIIPYLAYVEYGICLGKMDNGFLVEYFLPPENLKKLKLFLDDCVNRGFMDNYEVHPCCSAIALYSQFHKVVDKDGNLRFENNNEKELTYFTGLLEQKLNKRIKCGIHPGIKRNPLIVPLLCEHFREASLSSKKAYGLLKERVGEKMWDYFRDLKIKRKRNCGACVKFIQKTIKYLHENAEDFVQQVRISYTPLYLGENVGVYLIVRLKENRSVVDFAMEVAKKSLQLLVHPPYNRKGQMIFFIITNFRALVEILNEILPKYIDPSPNNKLFLRDLHKTRFWQESKLHNKINYCDVFDPVNVKWKYLHQEYMSKLKKM